MCALQHVKKHLVFGSRRLDLDLESVLLISSSNAVSDASWLLYEDFVQQSNSVNSADDAMQRNSPNFIA